MRNLSPQQVYRSIQTNLGFFCAGFYHFYVNDKTGFVGTTLRRTILLADWIGLDDKTFATTFVSLFMQVMGILQIPAFLGPHFSPFGVKIIAPWLDSTTWSVAKTESEWAKKKKKKRKGKKIANGTTVNKEKDL